MPTLGASFLLRFTSKAISFLASPLSLSPASLVCCQLMGVKGLLKEFPGGNMEDQSLRCLTLNILRGLFRRPANIETGILVFVCALRNKEAFNAADYVPIASKFQPQLVLLDIIHRWDYTLAFDRYPPIESSRCPIAWNHSWCCIPFSGVQSQSLSPRV